MRNKTKTEKKVELVRGHLLSSKYMKLVDNDTFKGKYWKVSINGRNFKLEKLGKKQMHKFNEKDIQMISFNDETISFKLFRQKEPINIDY